MSDIAAQLDTARERLQAPTSPYMTVPEVAELARCTDKPVRRAIHSGELLAFAPARTLLIRVADAVAWVESRPVCCPPVTRPSRPRPVKAGSVSAIRQIDSAL